MMSCHARAMIVFAVFFFLSMMTITWLNEQNMNAEEITEFLEMP